MIYIDMNIIVSYIDKEGPNYDRVIALTISKFRSLGVLLLRSQKSKRKIT